MTRRHNRFLAYVFAVVFLALLAWAILPSHALPDDYEVVIATWDSGRQTQSYRVGAYWYEGDGEPGLINQHAGTPKDWRYVE